MLFRENTFFSKCQTLHWTSPAAPHEQMRSLLPTWTGASSQTLLPGYRRTLQTSSSSESAAIWWVNPRRSLARFHNATCYTRLILIPHSKLFILRKISKSQMSINKLHAISAIKNYWFYCTFFSSCSKCHLYP